MKSSHDYDIIDSIIETIESECEKMSKREKWEIPIYSKREINEAGETIIKENVSEKEFRRAINVLNNWRASHAYPLQVIASNLRRNNKKAIVVQRLKRLDSIIGKLERFPTMKLYRIEDLGGCRVIVNSIGDVYASAEKYKNSKVRHTFIRERDYIKNPKQSGYRCLHMVYQFHSDTKETYNKNMRIEIQFRTKLQHIWATAVEIMGIYTKTSLKSSIGDVNILRFFVLVSSVFALKEGTPVAPNTSDNYADLAAELKKISSETKILDQLNAMSIVINHVKNNKQYKTMEYCILLLNYKTMTLRILPFNKNEIEKATKVYGGIERMENPDIDAVLVSATSFDALRAAYPNYFTDISHFRNMVIDMLKD